MFPLIFQLSSKQLMLELIYNIFFRLLFISKGNIVGSQNNDLGVEIVNLFSRSLSHLLILFLQILHRLFHVVIRLLFFPIIDYFLIASFTYL